jgi:patatin-like phospholipase
MLCSPARGVTALLLALQLPLSGCGGTRRCPACKESPTALPADGAMIDDGNVLATRLARVFGLKAAPNTMLLLSGGGGLGAWGAGLLNGWSHRHDRPVFDVVTGVSTGAMLGTFAFLGTPADDAVLKEQYTKLTPADIYRARPLLWALLFSPSLRVTWPLRELLAKYVTNPVIDRVKNAATDRLFLIATVDADVGAVRIWDMTAVAASPDPGRYDRYRSLLRAATAYPVLYPPVIIDGALHIDGGAREQIFAQKFGSAAATAYRTLHRLAQPKPQAYLVVNGQLVVPRQCVTPSIPAIGLRTIAVAMVEGSIGNLHKIRTQLEPNWGLNLSMIPDDYFIDPSNDSFDTAQMKRVYDSAYQWTQTMPWIKTMPDGTAVSPLPCPQSPAS